MATTYRDLWPQVVSWQNLLAAYRECRRRKRYTPEAVRFEFAWETHLLLLQRELLAGAYVPGDYRHFYIREPKLRKISAAPFRDRVVHHAVVRVLEPLYERRFIYDSYACRLGKGTHRALDRAQQYLRRYDYYLKTDIVRFFPNVDHEVLLTLLERSIGDAHLMDLLRTILRSGEGVLQDEATHGYFPGDDLFAVLRPKGLPIGNLTSQFLANVLLDPIDHYIKETLRVGGYVRYADDLVLLGEGKAELWDRRDALAERLAAVRLRLHAHKTQVRPSRAGLKFLGFVLHPYGRRLQQGAIARFNRRLRTLQWKFARGLIGPAELRAALGAWSAHAGHANTSGIRRTLWKRVRFRRGPAACEGPHLDTTPPKS